MIYQRENGLCTGKGFSNVNYNFRFVLYDDGHEGIFGYAINDGSTVALSTEKE